MPSTYDLRRNVEGARRSLRECLVQMLQGCAGRAMQALWRL